MKSWQFKWLAAVALVVYDVSGAVFARDYSILTVGDSITQGLYEIGSPQYGTRVGGYEPRLENEIASGTNGRHSAAVYNWGVMGEIAASGAGRISSILNSRSAEFILIMEGANDVFGGDTFDNTMNALDSMVTQSLSKGVTPILSNITPNTSSPYGGILNSNIVNYYNPSIKDIANNHQIPFVDNYSAMASDWGGYASSDGLHPNGSGYQRMAEEWYKAIEPLLDASVNIVPFITPLLLDD